MSTTARRHGSEYSYRLSNYNLSRFLLDQMGTRGRSGYEYDVHQALAARLRSGAEKGGLVPLGALLPRAYAERQLQATVEGSGAELVFDDPRGFRQALRRRSVLGRLGAVSITNLKGDGQVLVIGTGSSAQWISEAELVATGLDPGDPLFRRVTFQLHIAGFFLTVSHQLLVVAAENPDMEDVLRRDLLDGALNALDRVGLVGTGADGEPLGLFNDPDVPTVNFAGASTLAKLAEMEEAAVETQGGPDVRGWVTSPEVRQQWRTTPTAAGSGRMLMPDRTVLGYPTECTADTLAGIDPTPTPLTHGAAFGAWDELALATWGALDIVVDQFTLKKQAMVEIACFLYADVARFQPTAFATARDIVVP